MRSAQKCFPRRAASGAGHNINYSGDDHQTSEIEHSKTGHVSTRADETSNKKPLLRGRGSQSWWAYEDFARTVACTLTA